MEALRIISSFLICSVFHFHLFFVVSAADTLPDRYFINCGSASNVTVYSKVFAGDEKRLDSVAVHSSESSRTAEDRNSSDYELYQSARVFTKPSSYEFGIDEEGIHVVRFHFFHFPSLGKLSDARFNVSASGTSLLSNFTVGRAHSSNVPPVADFLMKIPKEKFRIDFVPYGEGFFGFINAIEVFLAPRELISDSNVEIRRVTPGGEIKGYNDLENRVIHVIHRINVGGDYIMPNNDTVLRYWVPDDDVGFMINKNAAKKSKPYAGRLNYVDGRATELNAPDDVYRTAKEMNIDADRLSTDFNVSWRFPVRTVAPHLVRMHFCDVVSTTPNELVKFNLYIYGKFRDEIWPYQEGGSQQATPFYMDYVVDPDEVGYMNISIGPPTSSTDQTSAFLNGVEIMELLGEVSGSNLVDGGSSRNRMLIIVGSCVGGGILGLALVILAIFCFAPRKKNWNNVDQFNWPLTPFQGGGSSYSRTTVRTTSDSPLGDLHLGLKISFADIQHATKRFDRKLMIGRGGFGEVYKGTLPDGRKVAVKRSNPEHGQGFSEFHTEIVVLSRIRHHHLVSLIGYCHENSEMILVYEFMEKGTLRDHLYTSEDESAGPTLRSKLSWEQRLEICIGAAKGLHYLHTGSSSAIIHRDIKSTNILLDEHYVAKVADFGLSHSSPVDQSHVSTEVKGSFGYLDPEYFKFFQLTQKSDVYSFGVVLLEVLCARPAVNTLLPPGQVNLVYWGLPWLQRGQLDQIVDPSLSGKINPNCLRKFGETVEKCLQECGVDRPNMVDVLWDLEYCLRLQHTASPAILYEDSTTDVMGLSPAFVRLPSDTIGNNDLPSDSFLFSEASQVDAGDVFSQLKIGDPR